MPRTMRERVKLLEDAGVVVVHEWNHIQFSGSWIDETHGFEVRFVVCPDRIPAVNVNWPGCGDRGASYAIGMAGTILATINFATDMLYDMQRGSVRGPG